MTEGHVRKHCWHVHHDRLCEVLTEPIENRIAYIRSEKPAGEIKLRLKLMKPVVGPLPECVVKAWAEYDKARVEYDKARVECVKARVEYDKAWAECVKARVECVKARVECDKALNSPEMDTLHAIECPDCPWDSKTIFPETI